ncbi:MAG: nucleotidyltransferase family protein [Candidatus Omnitrophica bacterium]|nr:nucleotidyltransferase family protein [Candidatus Omnitrophota bacterium]
MNVVFLCAGYGTRLYPLTERQPKSLLPIAGEAVLTHLLKKLKFLSSVDRVILVSNDRFYEHLSKWQETLQGKWVVCVVNDGTSDNEHRLGAIRDLKLALEREDSDMDVLVLAGDNLFDSSLESFVSFAQSKKPAASVGVYDVKDQMLARKYGLIQTDSSGKITAFFEKPKDPPTTLASMGVYFFPKETLYYLDQYLETNRNPDAPGFYISWLAQKTDVFAYRFSGAWFDIGDLNSYEKANRHFEGHLRKPDT